MSEPIEFSWMEHALDNKDIKDSHRWNYLRHRLWIKKIKQKE